MYITVIVGSNYEQEQTMAAMTGMLQSAMQCTPLTKKKNLHSWNVIVLSSERYSSVTVVLHEPQAST